MPPPPRRVTLVLCTADGTLLGALPPFDVELPWWQEVTDVVSGAARHHGCQVTVLRLLSVGAVTGDGHRDVAYLAETAGRTPAGLRRWDGDPLAEHRLRLPYARPGGPAADLRWATDQLAARGSGLIAPPEQRRTWNLSSVWRLPTSSGPAWLKVVPPFFAHEGRMIERLDPVAVPPLIATEGPRVLLADVPGGDRYDAPVALLVRMVAMLVGLQRDWVGRLDELAQLGLPDWRPEPLAEAGRRVLTTNAGSLDDGTLAALAGLLDGLPDRMARVADCGVPETLVHGDFHPGNVCGTEERLVLLDWGDCGIGHPMLDQAAFLERRTAAEAADVRRVWTRAWQDAVPGCEPDRAAALLAPVAALRQAVIYQTFLDGIEPDERVYHRDDPAAWLQRAAALG